VLIAFLSNKREKKKEEKEEEKEKKEKDKEKKKKKLFCISESLTDRLRFNGLWHFCFVKKFPSPCELC
jgi:hypothetical protein